MVYVRRGAENALVVTLPFGFYNQTPAGGEHSGPAILPTATPLHEGPSALVAEGPRRTVQRVVGQRKTVAWCALLSRLPAPRDVFQELVHRGELAVAHTEQAAFAVEHRCLRQHDVEVTDGAGPVLVERDFQVAT